ARDSRLGLIDAHAPRRSDGVFSRRHRGGEGWARANTPFVSFPPRAPRHYSGGELRIFSTRVINGELVHADRSHILTPQQDALVFFPSLNQHEVLPVRVPSKAFGDSRFTINGWIHRA